MFLCASMFLCKVGTARLDLEVKRAVQWQQTVEKRVGDQKEGSLDGGRRCQPW